MLLRDSLPGRAGGPPCQLNKKFHDYQDWVTDSLTVRYPEKIISMPPITD
jgi:hypothetical protein